MAADKERQCPAGDLPLPKPQLEIQPKDFSCLAHGHLLSGTVAFSRSSPWFWRPVLPRPFLNCNLQTSSSSDFKKETTCHCTLGWTNRLTMYRLLLKMSALTHSFSISQGEDNVQHLESHKAEAPR
jgi:hypothetical protein